MFTQSESKNGLNIESKLDHLNELINVKVLIRGSAENSNFN